MLAVWLVGIAPQGVGAGGGSAVDTLMGKVLRVHLADHDAWKKYAFDRHVIRRSLDEDGNATFQEELHFHIDPAGDGFDEVLYEIDGRTPTWQEVQKHRRAKRFTKHRDEAANFELANPIGEDLALGEMILEAKIPGRKLRQWNEYRYTNYRRVRN